MGPLFLASTPATVKCRTCGEMAGVSHFIACIQTKSRHYRKTDGDTLLLYFSITSGLSPPAICRREHVCSQLPVSTLTTLARRVSARGESFCRWVLLGFIRASGHTS